MHLHSIEILNIRAITKLEWKCPHSPISGRSGWHVIIGDNGSGKSTLLRAIALALIGPNDSEALRQDWATWLEGSATEGVVKISLKAHPDDSWAGGGQKMKNYLPAVGIRLKRKETKVEISPLLWRNNTPKRHVWSDKKGWFAASFGPFRRFSGGDKDEEKLYFSHPRMARHLSVFGENVALSECLAWLGQLRFEELDKNTRSGELLAELRAFINQPGLLPHDVRFEGVDSKSVRFVDGNGVEVPVNALGDGFRSILSLSFELLRQLSAAWPGTSIFDVANDGKITVKHNGVVMIDEIDAHLHPTWQRQIGFWLIKHFPRIQFIVTTHSPLVCQAAERGSIFRLPAPGLNEEARMVQGIERDRLIFGSVLDAYGTELFGLDVSRSEASKKKQERLAELNQKALSSTLPSKEAQERLSLQALFPASM
ncbi:MAG: AAA family ATPase [Candidatus Paceibacterota bacterium]